MDESEAFDHGSYQSYEEAAGAARNWVEGCLDEYWKPGMRADDLMKWYQQFGDDPQIIPGPDTGQVVFSARNYATEQSAIRCRNAE